MEQTAAQSEKIGKRHVISSQTMTALGFVAIVAVSETEYKTENVLLKSLPSI